MGKILNNKQKFEQGIPFGCSPPTKVAKKTPRYFIPTGTICRVTRIAEIDWREHVTKDDLSFERMEKYSSYSQEYEFRMKGWLIQVWREFVKHREDEAGYGK